MLKTNRSSTSLSGIPVTGGSSLLVILAILCFTVFTLLALSTAQADNRLAEASAKAVTYYYAADFEAEQTLAKLRQGVIPENVQVKDNVYSYTCPISDTQVLFVEVMLETPESDTHTDAATSDTATSDVSSDAWRILRWQAFSTVEYNDR